MNGLSPPSYRHSGTIPEQGFRHVLRILLSSQYLEFFIRQGLREITVPLVRSCPVNPSTEFASKGYLPETTSLAQCAELGGQLCGWAINGWLAKGIDEALQHNLGLGGTVVVTVNMRAVGLTDEVINDQVLCRLLR